MFAVVQTGGDVNAARRIGLLAPAVNADTQWCGVTAMFSKGRSPYTDSNHDGGN
jgi:hypothetical protein